MHLHEKVKLQHEMIIQYRQGLNELRRYLNSDKFRLDTTVQISDVILRLNELDNDLILLEIQMY